MNALDFNDANAYFVWQRQQEDAERRRNPKIDPTMLMPWGGHFAKETSCRLTEQQ